MFKPLIILAALATSGTAAPVSLAPANLTVETFNFGFSPKAIRLAAGRPVTIMFVNRSGSGHDFTAPAFFAAAAIAGAPLADGKVELGPHQSRSVTLTPRAGVYPVRCSHFLHKQFGMSAQIVVN